MDSAVAHEVRGGDGPAGAFGEESLFEDIAKFMAGAGINKDCITEQLGRLRFGTGEVLRP